MTDKLIERLYDRMVCSPAQNSCRNDFAMGQAAARIIADAKIIKAAEELAAVLDIVAAGDSKDYTDNYIIAGKALDAYRAAVSERDT